MRILDDVFDRYIKDVEKFYWDILFYVNKLFDKYFIDIVKKIKEVK